MTLDELLREKGTPVLRKVNKLKMPVYVLDNTTAGAHEFNRYYREMVTAKGWHEIVRTSSGGVSISRTNFHLPMWDVRLSNACIEMTIVGSFMLRIQFRQNSSVVQEEGEQKIYGRQAFAAFTKLLAKDGILLDDYAREDGAEIKKTIPKYIIKAENPMFIGESRIWQNCHHIDFHNSFPAGLVNTHPEFGKTIEQLYENRKTNPINKAILNYSIGFMQSIDGCQARWAHLAKDAIADNNARIEELAKRLKKAGRIVLLYNTDGIWYCGDIYHGEGEGKHLGEWENDHINCMFRAKSAGSYEFVENGKYYPVVRGRTNLDLIKPRENWQWGDIFKKEAKVIEFFWIAGEGITDANNNII